METPKKGKVRWPVMSVTIVLFVAMLIAIVVNAEAFYDILNNLVMNNLMWGLGWFVSLVCLFMVVICVIFLVTPLGKIKLGGPNAKPKLKYFGFSIPSLTRLRSLRLTAVLSIARLRLPLQVPVVSERSSYGITESSVSAQLTERSTI